MGSMSAWAQEEGLPALWRENAAPLMERLMMVFINHEKKSPSNSQAILKPGLEEFLAIYYP